MSNPADLVQVVVTSEDRRLSLTPIAPLRCVEALPANVPTVAIHADRLGQSLLGLGASLEHATCENLMKLPIAERERVLASLVSPTKGIGMNLMRLCIGTSDFVGEPYYTYDDVPDGETDPELARFSIERDRAYVLPVIKRAQRLNPDLLFFASPWSPPAWMKTSGRLGTGRLKREWFPVYARYLLKFIEAYAAEGIPIHALTVQNEPFHQDPHYPTALWSADAQRDFLRDHLGPLMERTGIATQIWCWDHNWNHPEVPRAILSDPEAARFVEGVAFHHYEGEVKAQSALGREFPDKSLYFTEGSVFGASGARTLIEILRHGARSYNAWVILLDEHQRPNRGPHEASPTCVELLDDSTVRYNFDYDMQGQFMKFLRRGAVRLESIAPPIDGFGQVAFRNPDGETVLVAANDSAAAVRFGVTAGEWRFVAEMPARSVATFRW